MADMGQVEFDLMYIDMMIPHHESVIALADVAVGELEDARLVTIAEAILETTPDVVRDYLEQFSARVEADELIVATQASTTETWLRSFELLAGAMHPVAV